MMDHTEHLLRSRSQPVLPLLIRHKCTHQKARIAGQDSKQAHRMNSKLGFGSLQTLNLLHAHVVFFSILPSWYLHSINELRWPVVSCKRLLITTCQPFWPLKLKLYTAISESSTRLPLFSFYSHLGRTRSCIIARLHLDLWCRAQV